MDSQRKKETRIAPFADASMRMVARSVATKSAKPVSRRDRDAAATLYRVNLAALSPRGRGGVIVVPRLETVKSLNEFSR